MDWYGIVKALHVISVISWMAGLLYLPRLFVYHASEPPGSATAETFKVMERRLYRAIMNPAMMATWVFGLAMLWMTPGWLEDGWMHAKLFLVLVLTATHHMMGRWRKAFAADENGNSTRFYRIANEIPTLLMVVVVFLVITKPF
ncbi:MULTISPECIES: protoporphyrinogen oxidase HemJ [Thalassobaculum]|uniref:Protoporphyrinogen IX oxidase n=1 Tax=Thalassobaculum litoreum DSM 18839 TaxID=1123362 RepID=A0A8G2EV53_9PROT|nr:MULTISPECIES: protoporphyrinogen oxidase HemJ [Thalassobaculum]SDF73069.1 putative membrane protein [Thalassobaculum litoreum DSM 18839]